MKNLENDKKDLHQGIHTVEVGVTNHGLMLLSDMDSDEQVRAQLSRWHLGPCFHVTDILDAQVVEGPGPEYKTWVQLQVKRGARILGTFIQQHWECGLSSWSLAQDEETLTIWCENCEELVKLRREGIESLVW